MPDVPARDLKGQASFTKTLETMTDELARGTVFAGRYEIIEELGVGGMGRVYRAFDKQLDEEVALKFLRPEIAADRRTVERFRNEIKIARKISHKNVCRIHDLHEDGKTLYLTMEYVRGEDLKSFLKRSKVLSTGTALSIARQIADGLSEAHKLDIVHRDLKPGNVMIDKEGMAKIMDFGIARAVRERGITGAGAIVGTPEYMSPEQVEGKEADQRADLYALGIILFEMVTGQVPFEGETPFAIANKHKSELPPTPKKLAPQIPEGLSKLILRCLEKEREKRYQTAEELLEDLATVEGALPMTEQISAGRPSTKRRSTMSRKVTLEFTPRRVLIPAAAVIILAGAFLLWRLVVRPPVPPPPSSRPALAILSFENISKNPELEQWKEGLPLFLRTQLGQSRFLRPLDEGTILGALKKLNLQQTGRFTTDEYKRIAALAGATHIISGSYLEAGGKLIVSFSLIDARTGAVIKPLQEEAPNREAVLSSIDSMVKKIKSALAIEEPAIDESVYRSTADVFTRDGKALQEYFIAAQARQIGDLPVAIKALENAVGFDPEFAMAYRSLSSIYANYGEYAKRYEYMRKAYELRERLPEEDQLSVEGSWLSLTEEGIPKAHVVYHKFVVRYPENSFARYQLAWTAPEAAETIKEYENLLFVWKYKSNAAYNMLTRQYCLRGDYRKARECWERSLVDIPKETWRHGILGILLIFEGNPDAARGEFERAAVGATDFDMKASIAYFHWAKGDIEKAFEIVESLCRAEKDPSVANGWLSTLKLTGGKSQEGLALSETIEKKLIDAGGGNIALARVRLSRGKDLLQTGHADRALEKFDSALAYIKKEEGRLPDLVLQGLIHERRTAMIWRACALCDLGRIDEVSALNKEIDNLIPKWIKERKEEPRLGCFCTNTELVAGKIALAEKDLPAAIKKLEESLEIMGGEDFWENSAHAYLLDSLGDAYQLSGSFEKAAQAFVRIPKLSTGRMDWPVIYARSYYKAGKVYEQMGKKVEAREKYDKFLDLWKDADPGLPEVEDAKKRLAALKP
jgi:serine/threonine protein kinase